jgi:DNA-binding transcriptional ArsR family regulator
MFCVERCEVWRTKGEFLELNGTLCADDYMHNLLNALKNDRRQEVIEALSERPRSLKELQERLNGKGYYHSRSTIAHTYVEPLVNVGLAQEKNSKYKLTLYGRNFKDLLSKFNVEDLLPPQSSCYEENVLRKLKGGPKDHLDLAKFVPENSLSRTLQRLKERGLVSKSKPPYYVFYFRTKKVPKRKFSPTEKRLYEAIPEVGVSAPDLSEKLSINLRRTYKYLCRLRRRRLVFTRKRPRTYELTPSGREVADFLEEAANLVLDASRASALLEERSKQIMAAPIVQF